MFRALSLLLLLASLPQCHAQTLTQQQSCSRFAGAIVSIDAAGKSRGTGFFVSSDGLLLTASHVVRDDSQAQSQYYAAIDVTLSSGEHVFAKPAIPGITVESIGQDYALLKATVPHPVPFLELGNTSEVEPGGDATIIGFPYSAIGADGKYMTTRFCLSASFAAVAKEVHPLKVARKTPAGLVPFDDPIQVDVIYFQGPSVKGLSGSPVISRASGHVVGILSTKLTGITQGLDQVRKSIVDTGETLSIEGVPFTKTVGAIITTLDNQLANGLGSAVGVEPAAQTIRESKRRARQVQH